MSSKPYADAAPAYQRAGWSPVPLPPGRKKSPPTGWTGYDAPVVSGADVAEWASNGHAGGNVGLRMPETVLGLDLDNYGDKPGLATMLAACERLGPMPPTICSTSRDDGASGIRLYRVPPGRRWADVLGPGVEVIHWGHRYAVVAPSIHPEGRPYRWVTPGGQPLERLPLPAELPELPPAWVVELDRGDACERTPKAALLAGEVAEYLTAMPADDPCQYVTRLLDDATAVLSGAVSRHDTARGYVIRIVRAGEQGHHGAAAALDTLEALWLESLARGAARPADPGEWARMVTGAVAMTTAAPTSELDKGCCGIVPPLSLVSDPPSTATTEDSPAAEAAEELDLAYERAAAFAREVETEAYRIRVRDAARGKVETERAGVAPPFDAGLLAAVLARPATPPQRVEGLIPSDGAAEIVAARKTGKTTLMLGLTRCLLTGEEFLGRFPVRPLVGRVGFLNFEVSAAQLARWADDADVPPDRLYLVNLRGRRNPLARGDDRELLAEQLQTHQVEALFVDPFSRAYHGKSQNDPGEVAAWLADLDRFARAEAGVSDLILSAHAGWDGERTRGASALEDWADVIITLVRDRDDDQVRYLRAEGRDVLVDEDRLEYDPTSRALRLAGAGSRKVSAKARHVEDLVPAVVAVVEATPGVTGYGLAKALREAGHGFQRGDEIKAVAMAVERQELRVEAGARNAKRYYRTPTYPDLPRPTPSGIGADLPRPPLYIGEVSGGGENADLPQAFDDMPEPPAPPLCTRCQHRPALRRGGMCAECANELTRQVRAVS